MTTVSHALRYAPTACRLSTAQTSVSAAVPLRHAFLLENWRPAVALQDKAPEFPQSVTVVCWGSTITRALYN